MKGQSHVVMYAILGVVITTGLFLGFGTPPNLNNDSLPPYDSNQNYVPVTGTQANADAGNQLQLNTLSYVTVSPIPSPTPASQQPSTQTCGIDNGSSCQNESGCQAFWVTCKNDHCVNFVNHKFSSPIEQQGGYTIYHGNYSCASVDDANWCQIIGRGIDGSYCMDKPVVYLYPKQPIFVNVDETSSPITNAIPPLNNQTGWNDVLASPNGNLFFNHQTYPYLFYESSVSTLTSPTTGIIIPVKSFIPRMTLYLKKMGLNDTETHDFLSYWNPRIVSSHSPYVQFSVFDSKEKKRIDDVLISPQPDVLIEVLAYFKPLSQPISLAPLQFPASIPHRTGFTAVEWGGTIDTQLH